MTKTLRDLNVGDKVAMIEGGWGSRASRPVHTVIQTKDRYIVTADSRDNRFKWRSGDGQRWGQEGMHGAYIQVLREGEEAEIAEERLRRSLVRKIEDTKWEACSTDTLQAVVSALVLRENSGPVA